MTVQEFINDYKKNNKTKKNYLDNFVKTEYVDFQDKLGICSTIFNESTENGVVNTPLQYILFTTTLLQLYFNIEIGEDIMFDFNLLDKEGFIDELVKNIPNGEYEKFHTVLQMVIDDYKERNDSFTKMNNKIISFVENLTNNFVDFTKFANIEGDMNG